MSSGMSSGMSFEIRSSVAKHSFRLSNIDIREIEDHLVRAESLLNQQKSKKDILQYLSKICSDKALIDPEWAILAGNLLMDMIHTEIPTSFANASSLMKHILDDDYFKFVSENKEVLENMIIHERDYQFDIFAVETLRKSYLAHLKVDDKSILMECPQYMYLRVATYLHYPDIDAIRRTYESLSQGSYSQATPTLFNSGLKKPQLSSCFLTSISDHMEGITKGWHDQAIISMNSGGIGCDYANIRHSEIGQHGFSRGLTPWLKITNEILKTVDQGGKRKGSGTMYIREWHVDVYEFIELRDEGPEDLRAKDLFLALMVSDLFMKRVEKDEMWSLFCPNKAKGLTEVWGSKFEDLYCFYEKQKIFTRQVRARELWANILNMQIKKGMPFIVYIDACNSKSNQKHSGIVRCSNLCVEIALNTGPDEIASCTLSSIAINSCVENGVFDFDKLEKLAGETVRNLNMVIDRNYYPRDIPQIRYSNMRHRPLGIGVQGYADTLALLDLSWVIGGESNGVAPQYDTPRYVINPKVQQLNAHIFETIYYACVRESIELAKIYGHYETFPGSPASKGQFQFDMWDGAPDNQRYSKEKWDTLRRDMIRHGLRNSTLLAIMPTASSAHILGNQEACEPFTDLIYTRTVLSGQFMIVNKHLVRDLKAIDLWSDKVVKAIIENKGSIQNLQIQKEDPRYERFQHLKLKYLTVFEIPQKVILQLGAGRGIYTCQTESRNCFMTNPTKTKLNAYHFTGWKLGLKTGMYYLRQKARTDPINFSGSAVLIPGKHKDEAIYVMADEEIKNDGRSRVGLGDSGAGVVSSTKKKIVCTDEICTSCNA